MLTENLSFITYRSTPHLDRKHTIFGKVVGGLDILDRMETTPTDSSDRPTKDIKINEIVVYVDPFEEFQKQRKEKEQATKVAEEKKREETDDQRTTWTGKRLREGKKTQASESMVGKYLKGPSRDKKDDDEIIEVVDEPYYEEQPKKKAKGGFGFGNFDSW